MSEEPGGHAEAGIARVQSRIGAQSNAAGRRFSLDDTAGRALGGFTAFALFVGLLWSIWALPPAKFGFLFVVGFLIVVLIGAYQVNVVRRREAKYDADVKGGRQAKP